MLGLVLLCLLSALVYSFVAALDDASPVCNDHDDRRCFSDLSALRRRPAAAAVDPWSRMAIRSPQPHIDSPNADPLRSEAGVLDWRRVSALLASLLLAAARWLNERWRDRTRHHSGVAESQHTNHRATTLSMMAALGLACPQTSRRGGQLDGGRKNALRIESPADGEINSECDETGKSSDESRSLTSVAFVTTEPIHSQPLLFSLTPCHSCSSNCSSCQLHRLTALLHWRSSRAPSNSTDVALPVRSCVVRVSCSAEHVQGVVIADANGLCMGGQFESRLSEDVSVRN